MADSLEQFAHQISASGLLSSADLQALVDATPARRQPRDARQLAQLLVKQNKLTAYQARQVYRGKGKSLVLGNYVVLDKLGQGGMGLVLKAEHQRMERIVALKVLSPSLTKTPEAVARFQQEVKAAARLEHPNIVTAYDADKAGGTHFLVMQYIDGSDFSTFVRKNGPLSVDQAVFCVVQAARGLEYAHQRGVVHRDIKPSNLLLGSDGTVRILDMGLARLESEGADQHQLTSTGLFGGTIDYMAPEQALDMKAADARSDIYSLGIMLWYLLTGRAPYEGPSAMARLLAHRETPIPSLRSACSDVSPKLDETFAHMVGKTPEDRYQTMSQVVAELEWCQEGPAIAPSVGAAAGEDTGLNAFLSNIGQTSGSFVPTRSAVKKEVVRSTSNVEPTFGIHPEDVDTDPESQHSLSVPMTTAPITRRRRRSPWWRHRVTWLTGSGRAALAAIESFVSTKRNRRARVWDAETGRGTLTLNGHTDDVFSVSFSPDGKRIVSGSHDDTVRAWDAATGGETLTLKGHTDSISSVISARTGSRSSVAAMTTR